MNRCKQCLLPDSFPRVRFHEDGRCNFCIEHERTQAKGGGLSSGRTRARKARLKASMERYLEKKRGKGQYDCLIGFSGGKDSTYLLHLFKEVYGLNVLAYTCDTGFLSDVARENIPRALDKLGVDHVWRRPPPEFYRRLYATLLRRPPRGGCVRSVCPKCFRVTGLVALQLAIEKEIPTVVYGLSAAQIPFPFYGYRVPKWVLMAALTVFKASPKALLGVSLLREEKRSLGIPRGDMGRLPDIILPFLALEYDLKRNTEAVLELDLIERGKESPLVTNCLINLLMMDIDYRRLGHNPYAWEFSELFREGQLDKDEWLAVDEEIRTGVFEREKIRLVRERLGLD